MSPYSFVTFLLNGPTLSFSFLFPFQCLTPTKLSATIVVLIGTAVYYGACDTCTNWLPSKQKLLVHVYTPFKNLSIDAFRFFLVSVSLLNNLSGMVVVLVDTGVHLNKTLSVRKCSQDSPNLMYILLLFPFQCLTPTKLSGTVVVLIGTAVYYRACDTCAGWLPSKTKLLLYANARMVHPNELIFSK